MRQLLVACGVVVIAGCSKKSEAPKETPPPPPPAVDAAGSTQEQPPSPDAKLVERGAYLAKAGGCLVCHTALGPQGPDLANIGAGGLEIKEKLGTWRSPNITPDKASGIGNWSDDQIVVAIREGIRPDGKQMQPIMPYMNYNALTDDDAKAIVAFLRTLKAIDRTVAKSDEMKIPLPKVPKPLNKKPADDPIEQGAYMASVMLCTHCHWTPTKSFAPAGPDKMFSGGFPMELPPLGKGVLYGSNITSDAETGIGKWTEEQIYMSIKTMQRPDGKLIQGPMLLLQSGWSQLEDKDLKNVAAFIKKLPPVKNKVPKSTFVPNAPGAGGPPAAGSGSGASGGSSAKGSGG